MKKVRLLEIHEITNEENKGSMLKATDNSKELKNKKEKVVDLLEQVNKKLDLLLSIVGGNQ